MVAQEGKKKKIWLTLRDTQTDTTPSHLPSPDFLFCSHFPRITRPEVDLRLTPETMDLETCASLPNQEVSGVVLGLAL